MTALRHALRSLLRAPGVSIAAVATLALGVAFTTTMFSVVDSVVLKPLPFRDPERVVVLEDVHAKSGKRDEISAPNFADLRDRTKTLQSLALFLSETRTFVGSGLPERVNVARVSPSIFEVLGVGPQIGSGFAANENETVVLSHAFWRTKFDADPTIVGKAVRIDGIAYTIVGVFPEQFRFPDADIALWQPLVLRDYERDFRGKRMFYALGRLAPGATIDNAGAEMRAISGSLAQQYPDNRDWTTVVIPVHESVIGNARPLWMLLAAALLVLVLACANVANLLLARASATREEMETRAALGATRRDIIVHYLRDAVVLACAGTLLGIAFSAKMIDVIAAIRPANLPNWNDLTLDIRALAAAAAALFVATIVAGLVPAIAATRAVDIAGVRGRFGVGGERGRGARRILTSAQVALAVVLLVCAALLLRSILAVQNVAAGFETESRVAATLEVPETAYDRTREIAFFTQYLDRVRALPGVVSAGGVSSLPLHRSGVDYDAEVFVDGAHWEGRAPEADFRVATPEYFRTMGIPLMRGRELLPSDDANAARVAIVNEAFVRQMIGTRDPIGLGIRAYCDQCPRSVIVGVVRDTHHRGLDHPARPEMYFPFTQEPHGTLTIVAKTRGDSRAVAAALPRELVRLDPNLALANMATVEEIVSRSIDDRRFNAQLLGAFSACALLLAAIGLYGSLSFSIAQRKQEIAIRMALGAARGNLWRLVLIEAGRPVLFGALAGLAASAFAAASLRAMMFGVTPADPISYVAVVATFGAVVLVVALAGFIRVASTDVRALLADA